MNNQLTLKDLPNYINNGAVLIDVRAESEYDNGHMNNSINIPYTIILTKIKCYPKNKCLILYCSTGKRSRIAVNLLKGIGYNNVYDLGKVDC